MNFHVSKLVVTTFSPDDFESIYLIEDYDYNVHVVHETDFMHACGICTLQLHPISLVVLACMHQLSGVVVSSCAGRQAPPPHCSTRREH